LQNFQISETQKKKKKDFGKNNKILMVVANLLVFSIDLMWLRWR